MSIITIGISLANITTQRAAVIPYIFRNDKILFLLGQDQDSGDITDLGGGVKKYESTLAAALRELNEESDEVFGQLKPNDSCVSQAVAILDKHMGSLFIHLDEMWFEKAPKLFEKKKGNILKKKSHNEIKRLLWVEENDFIELIRGGSLDDQNETPLKMWKKIRRFYYNGYNHKLREALTISSVA